MRPYFSSNGETAADAVADLLDLAGGLPPDRAVTLLVMVFSFTDPAIAEALTGFCRRRPGTRLHLLADWGQLSHAPSQVPGIETDGPPGTQVRYTSDQPYQWDPRAGRLRWSYHASRGFLHHKALIVLENGRPFGMVCGSANWTRTARESYENTLLLDARDTDEAEAVGRFALEFRALWCDRRLSLSPETARRHRAALQAWRPDPGAGVTRPPADLPDGRRGRLPALTWQPAAPPARSAIAFSGRMEEERQCFGHAPENHRRRFALASPAGPERSRPFSVTTMALAVIFAARPGDSLNLAMYGLSPRVAEYGALLDAARLGVTVRAVLDARVAGDVAHRMRHAARREGLPMRIRVSNRTMHQKYLLCPERACLATGTANMSTDSSRRHAEHRMLCRDAPDMAQHFSRDFNRMWEAPHVSS